MGQYQHHDFFSNFTASIKSGDLDLTTDILANELSDFIVYDIKKIIEALNKSEIKVDIKDTDESIVDLVIKNIATNKKLKSALAFIIAENNDLVNVKGKDSGKDVQLKKIKTIADGLSKIGSGIGEDSKDFKDNTMDQIVSKAGETKGYSRTIWNKDKSGINSVWAMVGGLAFFGVVIAIIYFKQKRDVSMAIPQMIMGGAVPMPAPMVQPPVVATTVPVATPVAPIALMPEPVITTPIV